LSFSSHSIKYCVPINFSACTVLIYPKVTLLNITEEFRNEKQKWQVEQFKLKLLLLSPYFIEIMGGVGGYKSMAKNLSCFSSLD
jgi:hypothetical protein